jgi:hypothetical protein
MRTSQAAGCDTIAASVAHLDMGSATSAYPPETFVRKLRDVETMLKTQKSR